MKAAEKTGKPDAAAWARRYRANHGTGSARGSGAADSRAPLSPDDIGLAVCGGCLFALLSGSFLSLIAGMAFLATQPGGEVVQLERPAETTSREPVTFPYEVGLTVEYSGTEGVFAFSTVAVMAVQREAFGNQFNYFYGYDAEGQFDASADGMGWDLQGYEVVRDPVSDRITGGNPMAKATALIANASLDQLGPAAGTIPQSGSQQRFLFNDVGNGLPTDINYRITVETYRLRTPGDVLCVLLESDPFPYRDPLDGEVISSTHNVLYITDPAMEHVYLVAGVFHARKGNDRLRVESWMHGHDSHGALPFRGLDNRFLRLFQRMGFEQNAQPLRTDTFLPPWAIHSLAARGMADTLAGAAAERKSNFAITATIGLALLIDTGVSAATTVLHDTGVIPWKYDGAANYLGQAVGLGGAKAINSFTNLNVNEYAFRKGGGIAGDIATLLTPAGWKKHGAIMGTKGIKTVRNVGLGGRSLRFSSRGVQLVRGSRTGFWHSAKFGNKLLDTLDAAKAVKVALGAYSLTDELLDRYAHGDARDFRLEHCGQTVRSNGGGAGATVDVWDIGSLPRGAAFDFVFDAMRIPDRFVIEYPVGTVILDTGWRGDSRYRNNPLYPGGIEGGGRGSVDAVFRKADHPLFRVITYGAESGTAWNYGITANCEAPPEPLSNLHLRDEVRSVSFRDEYGLFVPMYIPGSLHGEANERRLYGTARGFWGRYYTLYHRERRAESYKAAFRELSLQPDAEETWMDHLTGSLRVAGIGADRVRFVVDLVDHGAHAINQNAVVGGGLSATARSKLAGIGADLKKVNKSPAFATVAMALADVEATLQVGRTLAGALLLQALASDMAWERLEFIGQTMRAQQGIMDPAMEQAFQEARIDWAASQSMLGAFAVAVNDNLNEIVESSFVLGVTLAKLAGTLSNPLAWWVGAATMSYNSLKGISDNWELGQDAMALATLTLMVDINAPPHPLRDQIVTYGTYAYHSNMADVAHGNITRRTVNFVTGNRTHQEIRDEHRKKKAAALQARRQLDQ